MGKERFCGYSYVKVEKTYKKAKKRPLNVTDNSGAISVTTGQAAGDATKGSQGVSTIIANKSETGEVVKEKKENPRFWRGFLSETFYYFSSSFSAERDFKVGKKIISRIESCPVSSMTKRSMPMPIPPVGGMPDSKASM